MGFLHHTRRLLACAALAASLALVAAAPLRVSLQDETPRGLVVAEGGGSASADWARVAAERMVAHTRAAFALDGDAAVRVAILGGAGEAMARRFSDVPGTEVLALDPIARPDDLAELRTIHVVWIVGGDQDRYVKAWNDTPVEEVLVERWRLGAAIGGTSAGCAVLGEWVFDAAKGSIDEREALLDARHEELSLRDDFLPVVPGVLFDTHFTERGRLARLAVMLTALLGDKHDVLAIGIDDRTALLVTGDGRAEVIGEGAVTVLRAGPQCRATSRSGTPPSVRGLLHDQLIAGHVFDLVGRQIVQRPVGMQSELSDPAALSFDHKLKRVRGDDEKSAQLGDFAIGFDEPDALLTGELRFAAGSRRLAGAIVVPRCYAAPELDEARIGGAQFALASQPGRIVFYLDESIGLDVLTSNRLRVEQLGDEPGRSLVVLDGRAITATALSTALAKGSTERHRQSVALEGARLWLVPPGATFEP